jgi:dTDP-4-amino-4,6-dideoxygalactose transaminase
MKSTFTLDLKRLSRSARPMTPRNIRILEAACDQSPQAVKAAEKLVAACRENVRFLNRHLQSYRAWLDIPPLVDNVLYLAYTVTVKDGAPFCSSELRRALGRAGIETSPEFSFDQTTAVESSGGESTFCLPCHQYLTIQDMEYIIDTFESFFDETGHSRTSTKSHGKPDMS